MTGQHCSEHGEIMEFKGEFKAYMAASIHQQKRVETKLDKLFEVHDQQQIQIAHLQDKVTSHARWWGVVGGLIVTAAAWMINFFFGKG